MKQIKLTGKYAVGEHEFTMVDDEDYEELSKYRWCITLQVEHTRKGKKYRYQKPQINIHSRIKGKLVYIHRLIMRFPNCLVDHKDRNRMNNQKKNLRLVNSQQNAQNSTYRSNSFSKYRGVTFDKRRNLWYARVKVNKKYKFLGYYKNEIDAAISYDKSAIELYGEFANPNQEHFPEVAEYARLCLAESEEQC